MATYFPARPLRHYAAPIAIVLLPLLGFLAERRLGEPITDLMGLELYAIYALALIAYGTIVTRRVPPAVSSAAAGVLGTGAVIAALAALLALLPALFIVMFSLPWQGPPRSAYLRLSQFGVALVIAALALSPWLTSFALGRVAARTLRSSSMRTGKAFTIIWAVAGISLAAGAIFATRQVEAAWLAPHLQAFDTNDIARWEQSLRDIKGNLLCGHRRCLMPICLKLMRRFGVTTGECGPFACPFGFAIEAPDVPPDLAGPFMNVHGYPARQVCAVGD